jgi:hypothetical protein
MTCAHFASGCRQAWFVRKTSGAVREAMPKSQQSSLCSPRMDSDRRSSHGRIPASLRPTFARRLARVP